MKTKLYVSALLLSLLSLSSATAEVQCRPAHGGRNGYPEDLIIFDDQWSGDAQYVTVPTALLKEAAAHCKAATEALTCRETTEERSYVTNYYSGTETVGKFSAYALVSKRGTVLSTTRSEGACLEQRVNRIAESVRNLIRR